MIGSGLEALVAPGHRFVHLIGGGGKTTLMFQLARSILETGGTVITTTTTRIMPPTPEQSPSLLLGEVAHSEVVAALTRHRHVTLAFDADSETGKLFGHTTEHLSALHAARLADAIIVEADGSAGRPLKAHKEHEPVIAPDADAVVVLIGADAIGEPLSGETVHRAELFSGRFGLALRTHLDPAVVARVVEEDYLTTVPAGAATTIVLNRVSSAEAMRRALAVADLLRRNPRIARILVGDLLAGTLEVVT